jgi:hypothetical protein
MGFLSRAAKRAAPSNEAIYKGSKATVMNADKVSEQPDLRGGGRISKCVHGFMGCPGVKEKKRQFLNTGNLCPPCLAAVRRQLAGQLYIDPLASDIWKYRTADYDQVAAVNRTGARKGTFGGICNCLAAEWLKRILTNAGEGSAARIASLDLRRAEASMARFKQQDDLWRYDQNYDAATRFMGLKREVLLNNTPVTPGIAQEMIGCGNGAFMFEFWWSDNSGHACAMMIGSMVRYFDPNFGEFLFAKKDLLTFLSGLIGNSYNDPHTGIPDRYKYSRYTKVDSAAQQLAKKLGGH